VHYFFVVNGSNSLFLPKAKEIRYELLMTTITLMKHEYNQSGLIAHVVNHLI